MSDSSDDFVIIAAQSASVAGDVVTNVSRHLAFLTVARARGAHLVVFPELSLTGYEPVRAKEVAVRPDDSRLKPLRDFATEARITVVAGAPVLLGSGLHIAALAFSPIGSVAIYAKEYLHSGEEEFFAPGPGGGLLRVKEEPVALAICADFSHPEHAAAAAACGASVYAVGALITEQGYPADARILRRRASDHDMVVLMANHSAPTGGWLPVGRSAIWAKGGEQLVAAPGTAESLVEARSQPGCWRGEVIAIESTAWTS